MAAAEADLASMRMPPDPPQNLPITTALPALRRALESRRVAILEAPPGAGKSTGVPLALLGEAWLAGRRLLMLEPRRLAARAVANRMAVLLGEETGATIGYRTRLDSRIGPHTRVEVVTEGILTRHLQRDPALEGIGLVIFDEFHERNLPADLGLALTLDVRRHLRPDLGLLVMSATLESSRIAELLDDAPVITCKGQEFPVTTEYAARSPASTARIETITASSVLRALRETAGDLLVFLPGGGEIRRVADALEASGLPAQVALLPLYGDLPREEQDRALQPAPAGSRKVVLATNIAETSLTIEGTRVVVDSGFERRARFDPPSGMSRLERTRISQASADQRRGRAGRLGPGTCYRLWTEAEQRAMAAHAPAEILVADLAPLALELACWGCGDAGELRWLDPPPAGALSQARDLLKALGALDAGGRVTPHGQAMAALGTHPRLAHLLLRAREQGLAATGCALAALLSERDGAPAGVGQRDADIRARLADVRAGHAGAHLRRTAGVLARQLGVPYSPADISSDAAGTLLALAYPDRIGRARSAGTGRYQLSNGRGAFFAEADGLARSEFLVVAALDAGERDARIFLAAPISASEIRAACEDTIEEHERIAWDPREGAVVARRETRLGALLLADAPLPSADPSRMATAMLEGIRSLGISALPWTPALRQWQARVQFLARHDDGHAPWPDVSDEALLDHVEDWLAPWLAGMSRQTHLQRLDLGGALRGMLSWQQQQRLDELAPTHVSVPSGSRIALDYGDGEIPSLSVRLQEIFGLSATPRLAGGRVPVLIKLLSPARRPVQVTRDLESFWSGAYHEVKRELKGRYPKHYWPDDPLQATPTRRVRPR
jgi:ATP-dependent helicase HrpB